MKNIIIALLAASALLMGACSSMNTVERADAQGEKKMVKDKRVITDIGLDDFAYIGGVNESSEGGLLKVQVQLVNSSTAHRQVNYKFEWFDANGMADSSVTSNWRTVPIAPGETKYISAVATNPNVKDFSVKLLANMRD